MTGEHFYYQGLNYLEAGNYQSAIENFKQAEDCHFLRASLYNDWGRAYGGLHNHQNAIDFYSKAIQLDSDFGVAYYNIGEVLFNADQYQNAIDYFTKSIEKKSNRLWDCYYMRAHSFYSLAIETFRYESSNMLGIIKVRQLFAKAVTDIEKAISLSPNDDKDLYFLAGHIYKKVGDLNQARNYWTKAKNLGDSESAKMLLSF